MPGESSDVLRQRVCNFIAREEKIKGDPISMYVIGEFNARHVSDYVSKMRSTSTWGGMIEIKAFCALTKWKVVVHDIRGGHHGKQYACEPSDHRYSRTIDVTWSGGHYEPVRSR